MNWAAKNQMKWKSWKKLVAKKKCNLIVSIKRSESSWHVGTESKLNASCRDGDESSWSVSGRVSGKSSSSWSGRVEDSSGVYTVSSWSVLWYVSLVKMSVNLGFLIKL